MNRNKTIAAAICLVGMGFFAGWPVWHWLHAKAVSAALRARTQALVDKNAQLQLAWTIALEDGVLTYPEAKAIVEAAGEKVDPE